MARAQLHPPGQGSRSSSPRPTSPYHELRQWEEPLIDLGGSPISTGNVGYFSSVQTGSLPPHVARDGASAASASRTPKSDYEIALELAREQSLLDDDGLAELSPMLQAQMQIVASGLTEQRFKDEPRLPNYADETPSSSRGQRKANRKERSNIAGRNGPAHRKCDQCDRLGVDRVYCNLCTMTFCEVCWNECPPHRKGKLGPGGVPHEKTDQEIAEKIRGTLESVTTEEEQEELHMHDQSTTWFGVGRDEIDEPIFQDYGRYAALMLEGAPNQNMSKYPGLVSFVGTTGAGKSTLIKVLIELNYRGRKKFQTPVVGSIQHDHVPTSGDVHLYSDPHTFTTDKPLLYADCEGLQGGERDPKGARPRRMSMAGGSAGGKRTSSFQKKIRKLHHTSEREITWATTSEKRSRQYAVTHLYPRLLYTFSDVIVFVLKNPKTIEDVIEKLIVWAAAALEKSSNQPVLPHAIIALNASENSIDPALWDVNIATTWLLDSVQRTVYKNPKFKEFAQFWRERHKQIESVESLLLSYYSSVRVVRIPGLGRPKLISDQVTKLYNEITRACEESRRSKRALRMLMDANELQPYLQFAFDHFSQDLDTPFDFVQASFTNNPIPLDFGGNILKLALSMMEVWRNKLDAPAIFDELSHMVASCIMLDSVRHGIRGTAQAIFPEYLEHCDVALEDFCDRHWPCEFIGPKGHRCVNVRSGHESKGHQGKNGKVFAVGLYKSNFSVTTYQDVFRSKTYHFLNQLLAQLREGSDDESEERTASSIHKNAVMGPFYRHVGHPEAFISHSTCFSCLMIPPEHPLPCGHILCTPCVRAYGKLIVKNLIELRHCPLHSQETHWSAAWTIPLKPAAAGVRVLTLDGGGIRGIVELEVLRQIEQRLGGKIPIQAFFDLIVGTSTGGLIALGLGVKNWSLETCTHYFESLCRDAFTPRKGLGIPGLGFLIENHFGSKYETQPLQDALSGAFSDNEYLFGGRDANRPPIAKVAVTATTMSGQSVILTNYNRLLLGETKLPYLFQRPEKATAELKIWEAARATSAAPTYFKCFPHEPSKQVYQDGGIYYNNPVQVADMERRLIWPNVDHGYPDILLSIGTGFNPATRRSLPKSPTMPRTGVLSNLKALYRLAVDHIESSLDSERTWDSHLKVLSLPKHHEYRFRRINPELYYDPPKLDDVGAMRRLTSTVRDQLGRQGKILTEIAQQLVASCFYFELASPVEQLTNRSFSCKGYIQCRFLPYTDEIRNLGKLLRETQDAMHDPYFVIQERFREHVAEQSIITTEVIDTMIRHRKFVMGQLKLTVSSELAETEILLSIDGSLQYPISGFPKVLPQEDSRKAFRPKVSTVSNRWRRSSIRRQWRAPSPEDSLGAADTLTRYSASSYIVGNATPETLDEMSHRLGFAPVELDSVPAEEGRGGRSAVSSSEQLTMTGSPRELAVNEILVAELP